MSGTCTGRAGSTRRSTRRSPARCSTRTSRYQLLDFGATIDYHDLLEGQFEIDDVVVTTRYLHHPAITLGYRIEADGVTVVYSPDHEPTPDRSPDPRGRGFEPRGRRNTSRSSATPTS